MTSFVWGVASDVGRVRSINQDSVVARLGLFAVADGMGGHTGGEIAAEIAIDVLDDELVIVSTQDLIEAVHAMNAAILNRAEAEPSLTGMGTTLCALALVVAITLDPSASTGDAATGGAAGSAGPSTTPAAAAVVEAPPAPDAAAHRRAEVRDSREAGEGGEARASVQRLTAGVAGEVVTGPAPAAMPGIALEIQAALDRSSLWSPAVILTLSHVWSGDLAEADGRAAFALDLLGLDACPIRLVLLRLEARACAAGALGRLSAQGSVAYDPRSVARPFATAGGAVRLEVPIGWRVEVRGRFGAGATLWRDAFEFTPDVFHRVASVTLVGDVGLGVRFP